MCMIRVIGVAVLLGMTAQQSVADLVSGGDIVVGAGERQESVVSLLGDIEVYGTVDGDAVSIFGDVTLAPDAWVEGDMVSVFGDATVGLGGNVQGDLVSVFGDVSLAPGATITGDVVTVFGTLDRAPGSAIGGEYRREGPFENNDWGQSGRNRSPRIWNLLTFGPFGLFGAFGMFMSLLFSLLKLVLALAVAVVIVTLFPNHVARMGSWTGAAFLKNFLIGFAVAVLTPILVLAMIVTILGIPLVPLYLAGLFLMYLYGSVGVACWVGRLLPKQEHRTVMRNTVLGVLVIALLKMIPIVGIVVSLVVALTALGTPILTRFGTRTP